MHSVPVYIDLLTKENTEYIKGYGGRSRKVKNKGGCVCGGGGGVVCNCKNVLVLSGHVNFSECISDGCFTLYPQLE